MAFAVKLSQYEGPLDALLQLIEAEQLDISTVSLASVTDGYLRYLDAKPDIPPEELADFLVIATRLLLIKSRILLPFLGEAQDEGELDLESQLRMYKEYVDASKRIAEMIGRRRFVYVHEKLPKVDIGFSPPEDFGQAQMAQVILAVIRRIEPIVRVPKAAIEKAVSIHEKIKEIRDMLATSARMSFRDFVGRAETKSEVVVLFLALLELVKQRTVEAEQSEKFSDITIVRNEGATV